MPSGGHVGPSVAEELERLDGARRGAAGTADDLRERLALACRILATEGHEHLQLGHVSVRSDAPPDAFWVKAAGIGLAEVTPDDVVLVGANGDRLAGDRPLHREVPIHAEIYRRRPDVRAVVHTHALFAAALTASEAGFRIVSQDSIPFAPAPARFESARLIVNRELGAAVAEALGDRSAVLLRNHGIVVADATLEGAVYLAVALERSIRTQHAAAVLGDVREIDAADVEALRAELGESHAERARSVFESLSRSVRGADQRVSRGGG
jgi:L-fuculose-phosphate aldolase